MNKKAARKRALQIINSSDVFVLSTVDARNHPRSRIMGSKLVDKGMTVYMETFVDSNKVKQIKKKPSAQLLFPTKDHNEVVTLSGKATVEESMTVKKRIWQKNPVSSKYFSGYDDPRLGIIKFKPESLSYIGPKTGMEVIEVKL